MTSFDRLHPVLQHHIVNSLGWTSLRSTQEKAINPVLEGRDVLLLAPTAGGKTEAAVFPILSRMLSEHWSGLSVLYVCPLRALLNNLEPRLARYAGLVGRSVAVWHGDVDAGRKRSALLNPPDLLLTTPESIESILISRRINHSAFFSALRVVVADELHAFAGDDRGWHLLSLLERLNRITGRRIQRIGLSATVGNPHALAAWLSQTGEASVVGRSAPSSNDDVEIDFVGSLENAALVLSRVFRGEKRLVFCDSRSRVESLVAMLRLYGVRTFVCHSSLSTEERRRAEEACSQSSDCIIVSTSALELGIDLGDLDRVIQIDAPSRVSSFLQRMGRTGRRQGTRRNCLFLATTDDALVVASGLVRLWHEGAIEDVVPPPRPLHILAQQILALILQQQGLPENHWGTWIGKTFASIDRRAVDGLIAHMKSSGLLADGQGVLGMGFAAEASLGRRNFLELTSAFTTPLLMTVRHGNAELGEVAPTTLHPRRDGLTTLLLGGRSWRVNGVDWRKRVVWVEPSAEGGKSLWPGSSRLMPYSLCRAVEAALVEKHAPAKLSKRASARLEVLHEVYSFCDGHSIPLVMDGTGLGRLWTFAGSAVNEPLKCAIASGGGPTGGSDNFSVALKGASEASFPGLLARLQPADCRPSLPSDMDEALKFSTCLPPHERDQILVERLRDERGIEETLSRPVRLIRLDSRMSGARA